MQELSLYIASRMLFQTTLWQEKPVWLMLLVSFDHQKFLSDIRSALWNNSPHYLFGLFQFSESFFLLLTFNYFKAIFRLGSIPAGYSRNISKKKKERFWELQLPNKIMWWIISQSRPYIWKEFLMIKPYQ
jgi:hypothetical protein